MKATQILAGRRESALLAFPSVRRMADILAKRCREPSWVRTSVASLDRFRATTGYADLELLLERARADPPVAEQSLLSFASAFADQTADQVSALAMGAKIWFRLNGVHVTWRPLSGRATSSTLSSRNPQSCDHLILLALIGSGLHVAELLRLSKGDVGSLDAEGQLIQDMEADPLAVRYTPRRGKPRERITFLTYATRCALLAANPPAATAALTAPLIASGTGVRVNSSSVRRARERSQALIRIGSDVNVTLCRTTGDFFREWGLPGSRFTGPEDLNLEDYI
ncbi:hypothetical protein KSF_095430 [Reticulibacter mediterranei]|uniref:Uncharacterized protein n=1 Tax=Reticulibacter mediterranei TaxID=2778369 RepID=A0A8J3IZ83_9CHLR|nr:hypothetical protein [Reticulibacter mediterranei]GHO99495.1 hypothetical protein KSF_095430 [Reticulibacter mediterranei]